MKACLIVLLLSFSSLVAAQPQLIAYWAHNDNELPGGGFGYQPSDFPQSPDLGAGALQLRNFNAATSVNANGDTVFDCIQSFGGSAINAQSGFAAGGSISPQGCEDLSNNGMSIELQVDTTGLRDIKVSWAWRATSTGFNSRTFSWSLDGETFNEIGSDSGTPTSFTVQSYDLSAIEDLNDQSAVYFRITLDGASAAGGNNRFDNITVIATPLDDGPIDPRESIFAADFASDPFADGWTDQNVVGNQTWNWNANFQNVEFSAFAGGCQVNDNWLVSPAIDLDGFEAIELDVVLSRNFSGTNDLLIYFSPDYPGSGNPGDFTWGLIETIDFSQLPSVNTGFEFGPFDDLDGVEGEIRLAFRTGFESGNNCGTWRVVDVEVSGREVEPPFCAADSADDETLTRIHAIQGDGFESPIQGSTVEVQAIVVGTFQDEEAGQIGGFFLQEPNANQDDDPLTSEGVFISPFGATTDLVDVSIGDEVRIQGVVRERFGQTEVFQVARIERCAADQLERVSPAVIELPVDDLIELEAVEGMWVRLPQALTVTEVFNAARFAEFGVATDRLFQPTQVVSPGEAANALQELNNRSRLIIDQGLEGAYRTPFQPGLDGTPLNASNPIRVGYRIQGDFEGVMGFGFSNYRLFALQAAEFDEAESPRTEQPPELPAGNLRIGSFNVENLFTTLQTNGVGCGPNNLSCRGASSQSELERQRDKLVSAIAAMDVDVLGLMEIENDDDDSTLTFLVDAINQVDAVGDWDFIATGFKGTDAIKNAIIYRTGSVEPVGDFAVLDSNTPIVPPIDTSRQRPVLKQAFRHGDGSVFTVSVVHFRSKICGNAAGANADQGDGQSCWNALRTESVQSLRAWLDSDPTGTGTDLKLVVGDFNAYAQEDPLQVLDSAGFVNEAIRSNADHPAVYSFVFQGQSGSLDHVLASAALSEFVLGATNWAINADEIPAFAYPETLPSSSLPKPDDFFNPDPFRSSDHDPLIVSLALPSIPAEVQWAHLAPFAAGDASKVDIFVDGEPLLSGVAYGASTGYLELTPGTVTVEIFPVGAAQPAIASTLELIAGQRYSAIAIGDGLNQALDLKLLADEVSAPAGGQVKLRLGHLAPFAPGAASAEVRLADGNLLAQLDFGAVGDFVELPGGSYDLVITAPGGDPVLIDPVAVEFGGGEIVSAFATGNEEFQILGAYALPAAAPGFFIDLNAEVLFEDAFQIYTGEELEITVITAPPGLAVEVLYDGAETLPVDAGTYLVTASIIEPGFVGSAEISFVVAPAAAGLAFEDLSQRFTGEGLAPAVITEPEGLAFELSFDGEPELPIEVGDYIVTATIDENNFIGSASAIFRILAADAQSLEILAQPGGSNLAGQPLTPALSVAVIDGTGEVATDDNSTVIELFLLVDAQTINDPMARSAAPFATRVVENGVAVFDDLVINQTGQGYRFVIQDGTGELPALISDPFNVVGDRLFDDRFEMP
ncbi:MAG: ExeM/NucH family extracellular endonuclease [Wenzhouxiangellaceae bacterium]|nr:MAG: ExeM/NucH family extracellular endonuclease [Wenzhouxiangellaceae bacterium]